MGWSRFLRRGRWDDERAKELQDYLLHEIDDNIARGMTPGEATRAAHRKLGNATRVREDIYDMNTLRFAAAFWQDLRFGLRLLLKNPTFSVVAILTLALGTGANAAIFQLVTAVRLRTLPVERPQELVSIGINTNDKGRTGRFMSRRPFFSEPLWQALRADHEPFSHVFAWGLAGWNLASDGEYRAAQGLYVSGSFFPALGIRAQQGRLLTEADDVKGCGAPAAVLSHGFWQSRYGGRLPIVGESIMLDNQPFDIAGITPPDFFGVEVGRTFDVALPLCAEPLFRGEGSGIGQGAVWYLDIMARLKPGWTIDQAQARLAAQSPGVFRATLPPRYNASTATDYLAFSFTAAPAATGVSSVRRTYETQLWVLLGATALVLLITCANLANLMLARSTAREREVAVRLAIGASRGRIVRQLLSESLLLAALGAMGGVLLAGWLSQSLVGFLSTENNRLFVDLSPDWRVFVFVTGVAVLACLLFGLSPALKVTATSPGKAIQAGGRTSTDSHERFTLRRALVVVQVALSMVLVVGALLFARSLRNLVTLDPGFSQDGILAINVDVRRSGLSPGAWTQTFTQVMERVRAVPGVRHAAEALIVPVSGSGWNQNILVDGVLRDGIVNFNRVGPDYFRALGTPLLAGRTFGPEDRPGATETAIVNETFARKYFGGTNPIGRTFQLQMNQGDAQPYYQIVGLVKDSKYTDVREELTPIGYFAAAQEEARDADPYLDLVVRSDLPLSAIAPAITRAVREVAPGSTVAYELVRNYIRDSLATERVMASLSGFFGVLAMMIATIGLYGVMSYMVTRRQVEIGVRMALGADPAAVVRMVLAESGVLLAAGVVIGVALAAGLSRFAASLLYGLEPWDPASFALAAGALGFVSIVAAWIPARRASRLTPTIALRE